MDQNVEQDPVYLEMFCLQLYSLCTAAEVALNSANGCMMIPVDLLWENAYAQK